MSWLTWLVEKEDMILCERLLYYPKALEWAALDNKLLMRAIQLDSIKSVDFLLNIPKIADTMIADVDAVLKKLMEAGNLKLEIMAKVLEPIMIDRLIKGKFKMNANGEEKVIYEKLELFVLEQINFIFNSTGDIILDKDNIINTIRNLIVKSISEKWDRYQEVVEAMDNMIFHPVRKESRYLIDENLKKMLGEFIDLRAILPYQSQKMAELDAKRRWDTKYQWDDDNTKISPDPAPKEELSYKNEEGVVIKYEYEYRISSEAEYQEYQNTTNKMVLSALDLKRQEDKLKEKLQEKLQEKPKEQEKSRWGALLSRKPRPDGGRSKCVIM